jgi:hypothetical protein
MTTKPDDQTQLCSPLVEGAPAECSRCASPLCLRKQVLNLAVGNIETMFCLECLSAESKQEPDELLAGMKLYVLGRDCLRKEWQKYATESFCPARETCYPSICFAHTE